MPTRYYAKNGKLYDAGVEITAEEAERMLKEYPQKIKANSANSGGPAAAASKLANQQLAKDIAEIRQALVDRSVQK